MGRTSVRLTACLVAALWLAPSAASARDLRLVEAVKRQDKQAVQALLAQKVDVNITQPDGATALHWAAYRDDLATTEALLKAGAKANVVNDYGVSPLSLAATHAAAPVVEALLKAGANVNLALPTGETPLMTAAHAGNAGVIAALVKHGAPLDATEATKGQNALMWAAAAGHVAATQALLDAGASLKTASKAGYTPLLLAARTGNLDLTTLLLAKGANVNETATDGTSALHVAVVRGHVDLALFLLGKGANPKADGPGYTALHWAAGRWEGQMTFDYSNAEEGELAMLAGVPVKRRVELVNALIKAGADVNARLSKNPPRFGTNLWMTQITGATPFVLAAQSADLPTMKALLSAGADPSLMTKDNANALMFAASFGRVPGESRVTEEAGLAAVELCRSLGNAVTQTDTNGTTALHAVAYYGWVKMTQWLLDHGAEINAKNKKGETPLRIAQGTVVANMLHTEPKVAELLLKSGGKAD